MIIIISTPSDHFLPLVFPATWSCSVILTRSEPPTNPMTIFLRRARRISTISGDTVYAFIVSTNTMARGEAVLYELESTFHQRQIDKVTSEVCWQNQRIPLKKTAGGQDEQEKCPEISGRPMTDHDSVLVVRVHKARFCKKPLYLSPHHASISLSYLFSPA